MSDIPGDVAVSSRQESQHSENQRDKAELAEELSRRFEDIDRHVGNRIRRRRISLGYSQQMLGRMTAISTQQMHKYEVGANRITAGRLYQVAVALGVPPSSFFEDLAETGEPARAGETGRRERLCLEMARNFAAIEDPQHQEALCTVARVLAAGTAAQDGAAEPLNGTP